MENIRKIYVDSRFCLRSGESGKFTITLPYPVVIENNTKMFIDNLSIPISYYTINSNNQNLYIKIFYYNGSDYLDNKYTIKLPVGNYSGFTFADSLQLALNAIVLPAMNFKFFITYSLNNNNIKIALQDLRTEQNSFSSSTEVSIYADHDLINETSNKNIAESNNTKSLNLTLKILNTFTITTDRPYECYLDLHNIRNIYMHSKTLSNSDTISNWNVDSIIKVIPVHVGYNELNFDGITSAFDYQLLSKRNLQNIDVYFTDTHNNVIDFNGSHLSFSMLFINE